MEFLTGLLQEGMPGGASFPFNGPGRCGNIVDHSVNGTLHGVGDSCADLLENFMRDFRVPSRHPIHGLDCTHHNGFAVSADITMDADASYRKQSSKVLPWNLHLAAFCCGFKFLLDNGATRALTNHNTLLESIHQVRTAKPGPGKGWRSATLMSKFGPTHELRLCTIHEEVRRHGQRHVLRQTADVVMRLDGVFRTTSRFNPIGCNGSLNEVFCPAFFLLVLKNPNEQFTDDLALFAPVP